MTRDELITIAKGMPLDDRAMIATSILDDVRAEADAADVDVATWIELRRRIAAYEANPAGLLTWEQVKARLASK